MSRRSLVGGAAALGVAATPLGALAQGTPEASPMASLAASPVAVDPGFLAAQDVLIAELQGSSGKRLRILSAVVGGKTPEEDALFAQEITRLTNIEIELVHPTADYGEKLLADLAAGVEYDVIYTNQDTVDVLVGDEVLTDLTDLINGSAILSNPTVIPTAEWDLIRYEGDRFYSSFQKFEGARMLTVRQDWMDQLGLAAPTTLDELYAVMVAFRDQDPAGNGAGVTLGLSTAAAYDIQPLMSAVGVMPGYVEVDGARTIPYASEAAIPGLEFLARLYAEGLLDPNFATATTADMRNLFLTDQVGFVTYWDTWVGLFNNTRLAADPNTTFQAVGIAAVAGPDGNIILNRGQPSVWTIPVNAPDPTTAFQFIEWWNTFPAITLGSLGVLDSDYTVTDG
ncbi:MAG: extracellular solute-binding protein, partial [Thermomicrobiales bacterium]